MSTAADSRLAWSVGRAVLMSPAELALRLRDQVVRAAWATRQATPEPEHRSEWELSRNTFSSGTGRGRLHPSHQADSDGKRGLLVEAPTPNHWPSLRALAEASRAISSIRSAALSDKAPDIQAEAR